MGGAGGGTLPVYVGTSHRQRHIDLAHDRLLTVAGQLRAAAARQAVVPVSNTGGAVAP
ncbi:MAG: hypothetical protein ACR2MB_00655 [Acidimicrobiales bacterium]